MGLACLLLGLLGQTNGLLAQQAALNVDQIMEGTSFTGHQPNGLFWAEDGSKLYFRWNPDDGPADSLYSVPGNGGTPTKVSPAERRALPAQNGTYNSTYKEKLYEKNGDLFLYTIKTGATRQITNTVDREEEPAFSADEQSVLYTLNGNLYQWQRSTGLVTQLTDFQEKSGGRGSKNKMEAWLEQDQLAYIEVLKTRDDRSNDTRTQRQYDQPQRPFVVRYGKQQSISDIQLAPNGRYITFILTTEAPSAKSTLVPSYVTKSGFVENLYSRPKVGSQLSHSTLGIIDLTADTVVYLDGSTLPGIQEAPAYYAEYNRPDTLPNPRSFFTYGPFWNGDGTQAFVVLRSRDNKDRWFALLDAATGQLETVYRHHDDAWVNGPGIGYNFSAGQCGWLPDNQQLWFLTEETGYSHLNTYHVKTRKRKALTAGNWEVHDAFIGRNNKYWYLTTSEVHPGERHFYRMALKGGKREQLTSMEGNNTVVLSPNGQRLGIRYSYYNKPWEVYLADAKKGATATRTTTSTTTAFDAYPWRQPELVTFTAADGTTVYARLYKAKGGTVASPGVIFVHGAGYLQNAHKWWSNYYREYMFHNLLADQGYTVLDIDYRGSAGYGRDFRTGIYRFMGGKDLDDHVDGARYLAGEHGVDADNIGIYGGSYGGFITLMALFTQPTIFKAGASLRPVTDWAHYNHPYTSNILNTPVTDSIAYYKSSPIYHAEGLRDALLICHGMIDRNVQFQDVARLAQRLIELRKNNWEVALYPLEGHGFREPTSWADEYRRILKLFEENLK